MKPHIDLWKIAGTAGMIFYILVACFILVWSFLDAISRS